MEKILDKEALRRMLHRLAAEVVEHHGDCQDLLLVGIQTRGVPLAKRLMQWIPASALGILDITFYRDDLSMIAPHPIVKETHIPQSIQGKPVILVDDVLYTGRTIRAAMDSLMDYGRPSKVELLVLIDRGGRELPIAPDYVGRKMVVPSDKLVEVRLEEVDGVDEVVIQERACVEA